MNSLKEPGLFQRSFQAELSVGTPRFCFRVKCFCPEDIYKRVLVIKYQKLINDALEMKAILEDEGYNIALAINAAGTKDNFLLLFDWLVANEGPDSEVVFFFSGHGSRTQDGSWDTDVESDGYDECLVSWDFYAISDSYVSGKVAEMESNHIAMIYCSCHSGGMFDQSYETRIGVVYIDAAEADQYGWDYLDLQNTLFFYYFGDQGILNGPYNNLQDAFDYARPYVIAEQPDSCPVMIDLLGTPFYVK